MATSHPELCVVMEERVMMMLISTQVTLVVAQIENAASSTYDDRLWRAVSLAKPVALRAWITTDGA
jgi:hypothetical protein